MKRSFLGIGIFGILLILFGATFALQGDGMIGGSVMSGNPFWIYAGSGIAVVGLIIAGTGFAMGSRSGKKVETKETNQSENAPKSDTP